MLKAINDLGRHVGAMAPELNRAVLDVVASGWYVLGAEVEAFEQEFAAYCGSPHCIGVANGTDALELALRAVGVGLGDRVMTVANAGGYSTTAIMALGAVPHYVDIDPDTLLISPTNLQQADLGKARAIIVTHLYGRLADIEAILAVAKCWGIPVIEDCAQAHGARRHGQRAGTWGSVGCFSFYPTKNLGALGDGGAVITANADIAARLRRLRQYGWSQKYCSTDTGGRNSRLDEIQAAVLRVQLPRLDNWNNRRRTIAERYRTGIRHADIQPEVAWAGEDHVAHLCIVRSAARDALRTHLLAHGVPTDIHYPLPDHRQASVMGRIEAVSLPATERACAEVLTLPCFPEMTDAEVEWVVSTVNEWRP